MVKVRNLYELSAAELKAMGKEHHVKNWWSLSKAALICELSVALSEPEPEVPANTLIETAPPEVIPMVLESERPLKKPNLKIHELTFDGKTQTIREWAEELEMPWPTLYDRINRNGWTVEEALTVPVGGRRRKHK